jgi:hypothetical protein
VSGRSSSSSRWKGVQAVLELGDSPIGDGVSAPPGLRNLGVDRVRHGGGDRRVGRCDQCRLGRAGFISQATKDCSAAGTGAAGAAGRRGVSRQPAPAGE